MFQSLLNRINLENRLTVSIIGGFSIAFIIFLTIYVIILPSDKNFDTAKDSSLVDFVRLRINDFLVGMFRGIGIKLIDFKLEFGRIKINGKNEIILADEISPDTCRLWDSVTDKKLDKDRFRKDLGDLIPAYTEVAKRLGILHEQSNVSAVNVTKLSSVKKKRK